MTTLWFILVGFMLTMYVLLDGFDLGAGVIHLLAARSDAESRTILRAIGPVWDGNEVWLIAAGGTLFFTFPLLYASSFSGFYLPLIIVLWLLMLRGVSIELRSHIQNAVWSAFWDGTFVLGSTLLAFFYGAALANVVRGVPLAPGGFFFEPLWTDFFNAKASTPGILDWYTVLIGLLALAALTTHGAAYLVVKTTGVVHDRARRIVPRAWAATLLLTILGTIATFSLRSSMLTRFNDHP
ncbi:MAG TPA: cytochrome d ubiquinol oxidase subunit II, partial [Chloroflexota bacterium]|nr:cytochrome d ubiquinol oxidase subunit II [Chloroflexota bacterium]